MRGRWWRSRIGACRGARSRWTAALWALGLLGAATGCDQPSSRVDGGDLLGVFERDAAADAPVEASSAASSAASSTAAVEALPTLKRKPVAGPCLLARGEPRKSDRRVARRPACRGARIVEWRDPQGTPRYACIYAPSDLERHAPLPLVLFFHGEIHTPTVVHRETGLRRRARKMDLIGSPTRRGFVLLAPQARRIDDELRWDTDYPAPDNPDVLTVDHFMAELEREGAVDRRRVYALGASAGGEMAAMVAMLRPERVAAFALVASAPSKLHWSCEGSPPPATVVYRACDAIVPCADVEAWLGERQQAGATTVSLRLGAGKAEEPHCALGNRCRRSRGTANHHRWPRSREPELLEFLARYQLE